LRLLTYRNSDGIGDALDASEISLPGVSLSTGQVPNGVVQDELANALFSGILYLASGIGVGWERF